ncbi:MAG TPA: TIGR00159 family protein [Treponema sp.]|nr:TIGR00159 family protein [Treponema sp.]HBB42123.1 TIGR00159 family protein [Treponema sp.]HCA20358.1 TIGR00159 family protein [Treponema sp.]
MNGIESLLKMYDYVRPVLDIAILFFLMYKGYQLVMRTNSAQILKAVVIVALAFGVVKVLHLSTMLWIFENIAPALLIGLVIVFQPEIRKVMINLGQSSWFQRNKSLYTGDTIRQVLIAADTLSNQKRGMLVVFLRKTQLSDIEKTGEFLDSADMEKKTYKGDMNVSSSLLISIFAFDTPLHDGACIIQNDRLVAAGCFLPLSEQFDIKKTYGTRHRAALGVSEVSDAVTLIVSEETGAKSLAYDSKLHYDLSTEQLEATLTRLLGVDKDDEKGDDADDIEAVS